MSSVFISRPKRPCACICHQFLYVPAILLFVKKEYNVGLFSKVHQLYKYKCLSVNSMFPCSSFPCFSLGSFLPSCIFGFQLGVFYSDSPML